MTLIADNFMSSGGGAHIAGLPTETSASEVMLLAFNTMVVFWWLHYWICGNIH